MTCRFLRLFALPFVFVAGAGGGAPPAFSSPRTSTPSLFVYSGAGFRLPIEEAARVFEERFGIHVDATFAGSGCLLAQAELAGNGDVFIPGELHYLEKARERGVAGRGVSLAFLRPIILVREGNPFHVADLRDLARPGLRLGLGDPQSVAVGLAAERWLSASLDAATRAAVLERVTTRALNVNELGSQLALGALDAAIVWDATAPLFPNLTTIAPVSSLAHRTIVTGAVLSSSRHPENAGRFLSFLSEEDGRAIFRRFGYEPYDGTAGGSSDVAAAR